MNLPITTSTPPILTAPITVIIQKQAPPKPEPKLYKIVENDTLEKIAGEQHTTVSRLFSKNTAIVDPDIIETGQTLAIPADDEQLADRPLPGITPSAGNTGNPGNSPASNTYYQGQCVWFVKNQLSWVQNGWGNANQWVYTSGHRVSSTPIVGAVASAINYSHVALVTGISGDNVIVSEMNYVGLGVESSRRAPISEFEYILP